jgi:signal transduction histidine kinase
MSAATQEKAFDLFFTSRPEGTGMGLALVRRFVERSGGGVSIESVPDRGTTVRLILPCRGPASPSLNP